MTAPMVRTVHPSCTPECKHSLQKLEPNLAALATRVYAGPGAHMPSEIPPEHAERCGSCGYGKVWHERVAKDLKCPQETADKNGRRGTFKLAPPPERLTYQEIIRRDAAAKAAEIEQARKPYEPTVTPPPLVPARPPTSPGELAGYQGRQAVGLGRLAAAAGWEVRAAYWQVHDGSEGCAVMMRRDDLYAVAVWRRPPGSVGKLSGWGADGAYGLKRGETAIRMNHTQLEGVFTNA